MKFLKTGRILSAHRIVITCISAVCACTIHAAEQPAPKSEKTIARIREYRKAIDLCLADYMSAYESNEHDKLNDLEKSLNNLVEEYEEVSGDIIEKLDPHDYTTLESVLKSDINNGTITDRFSSSRVPQRLKNALVYGIATGSAFAAIIHAMIILSNRQPLGEWKPAFIVSGTLTGILNWFTQKCAEDANRERLTSLINKIEEIEKSVREKIRASQIKVR